MTYNIALNNIVSMGTSDDDLEWLYNQSLEMDNVVEIGVWKGRASHALLSGCKGTVYCVDHFKGSLTERKTTHLEAVEKDIYSDFIKNVGHFKNMTLIKMDSAEASGLFDDKSVDMVFIDGGHDYETVNADIKAWLPKCKKLICGHDVIQEGVPRALKENFPDGFETYGGNIWLVRL